MNGIEKMQSIANTYYDKAQKLFDEINNLKSEKEALAKSEEEALEKGDFELIQKVAKKRAELNEIISTYQNAIDKGNKGYSEKELCDTWRDYCSQRNKELAPMIKEYEKKKKELWYDVKKILLHEKETLRNRDELAVLFNDFGQHGTIKGRCELDGMNCMNMFDDYSIGYFFEDEFLKYSQSNSKENVMMCLASGELPGDIE